MANKIVVGVIIVVVALAVGFVIFLQQRQGEEAVQPPPEPESRIERMLKDLGAREKRQVLSDEEKEELLKDLGAREQRRQLTEEEKEEMLKSLGTGQ